jgi:rhodanese-related sulfurtransferase
VTGDRLLPTRNWQLATEQLATDMTTVDELLAAARAELDRVRPADLDRAMAEGAILIDIRPVEERERDGTLEGAIIIDRNVLEWRIAPSSRWRTVEAAPGQRVIVVCSDGYQSSLAAATLRRLGVDGATDVVGGYRSLIGIEVEGG